MRPEFQSDCQIALSNRLNDKIIVAAAKLSAQRHEQEASDDSGK